MKELFLLRPGIVFLNHGSYGACPRPVFEEYQRWQRELEEQPLEFLGRRSQELMYEARCALAKYLNTSPSNLVYITNATTGVNLLARSLKLEPGDQILATNHEYGAIDRTWRFICHKTGAEYARVPVSLPVSNHSELIEKFWQAVTPRTRVISLSHITSATALIFPVAEICRRARDAGILTIIDGAHAPGQIPLDLEEIGADFYSGNCHKWLCAPKGAGFLYARPEVQGLVEPFVVSWGWQSPETGPNTFVEWLEWQGTRDLAAFLSVPAAIKFQEEYSWNVVRVQCHEMLSEYRKRINQLTGQEPICPDTPDWYAQMATLRLPSCNAPELQRRLWVEFQVEIPHIIWEEQPFFRIAVQGYNTIEDLETLTAALVQVLNLAKKVS
jgi:isopenicillin-N epimerase